MQFYCFIRYSRIYSLSSSLCTPQFIHTRTQTHTSHTHVSQLGQLTVRGNWPEKAAAGGGSGTSGGNRAVPAVLEDPGSRAEDRRPPATPCLGHTPNVTQSLNSPQAIQRAIRAPVVIISYTADFCARFGGARLFIAFQPKLSETNASHLINYRLE